MSQDEEQNRRITENTGKIDKLDNRIGTLETGQALTGQKVDDLRTTFDTGMTDLKDVLKHRDAAADERRKTDIETNKLDREERKWFWNKVFAVVGSALTLAGAGGGAAYYAAADRPAQLVDQAAPAPEVSP